MKHFLFLCFSFGSTFFLWSQEPIGVRLCNSPNVLHRSIELEVCVVTASARSFGVCWNNDINPTIFDNFYLFQTDQEGQSHKISNLNPQTTYHFRLFELLPDGQAVYQDVIVLETLPELKIGDYFQGGVVVYLFQPKDSALYVAGEQHGLIVALEDLGSANWGIMGREVNPRTSDSIGKGQENTHNIIAFMKANGMTFLSGASNFSNVVHPCAAYLCANYEYEGFADWFLPSKEEWARVFHSLPIMPEIGIKYQQFYWTSSEVFLSFSLGKKRRKETRSQHRNAWKGDFRNQSLVHFAFGKKNNSALVRPMRYF